MNSVAPVTAAASQPTGPVLRLSVCPICGCADLHTRFERWSRAVEECRACHVRMLNPQPDDATLAGIYTERYFLGAGDADATEHITALKRATAQRYVSQLAARRPPAGTRLLEVGCGQGEFLVEAQRAGFDVYGVEYAAAAVATARARLGAAGSGAERVQVGELAAARFADAAFDVVAFFDVIEHVRDPLAFLREVRRILRPNGCVFVVTPSLDSLSARLMGRHWMEYKLEHLYYFTKKALAAALQQAGFEDVRFEPNVKMVSLELIALHFMRFPVPLATPLVRCGRALTPRWLARRPLAATPSGMLATAQKVS